MSIFSTDSKLYKGISWFGDIVVLNLLWLLFSLPIVTIGASTVAAFTVALKMIDGNEGYMFKGFWKAFKGNWKQGTLLWLVTLAAGYAIYLDVQLLTKQDDPSYLLIIVSIVSILFIFFALLYAYPLCARYDNKWYLHIKNSLILSIRYIKKTLFLVLILALEVALCFWNEKTLILIIIIGPMIMMYTIAGSARKIFSIVDKINADEAAMAKAKAEGKEYADKVAAEADKNESETNSTK